MNHDPSVYFLFPSQPRTPDPSRFRDLAWKCRIDGKHLYIELIHERAAFRLDRPGVFALTLELPDVPRKHPRWFGDELSIPLQSSDQEATPLELVVCDQYLALRGPWRMATLAGGGEIESDDGPGCLTLEYVGNGVIKAGDSGALGGSLFERAPAGAVRRQEPSTLSPPPGIANDNANRALWDHLWILHKVATYEPSGFHTYRWQDPGRGYFRTLFGHWDTLHSALEWLLADPGRSTEMMRDYFTLWDEPTGMVGMRWRPNEKMHDRPWTTPPLWANVSWSIYLSTKDRSFLALAYERCVQNLGWWNSCRRFDALPLYYYLNIGESGYDNMPRGDWGSDVSQMPEGSGYAPIDLNAQLAEFCAILAKMARELGEAERAQEFLTQSRAIVDAVRTHLWDEASGFFYDLHVPTGTLQRVKTIASFWALTCGVASDTQARGLIDHLTNPSEFWTTHPIPSVALDEPSFQLEMWRGPVWNSQNLWVARGLRRYGERDLARALAQKSWLATLEVFMRTGKVFEFYNPFGPDLSRLRRKGDSGGPCAYYIGHNPLHVLLMENLTA